MEDYKHLIGKKLSLIIWNSDDESDVRVLSGEVVDEGQGFYFINRSYNWRLQLDPEKLDRVREVSDDMKEILQDADYGLSLTMGTLASDSHEGFIPTGIKWD